MTFLMLAMAMATTELSCPLELETTQSATVSSTWEQSVRLAKNRLIGFSVFYNHPDTMAEWAPDKVVRDGDREHSTYLLPDSLTKQVWIECYYSDTTVKIRKRLPDSVRHCEVTRNKKLRLMEAASCRLAD